MENLEKCLNVFFSETIRWMKLILFKPVYDIILYINWSGENWLVWLLLNIFVVIPAQ